MYRTGLQNNIHFAQIVAHDLRLGAVQSADQIVVMDGGPHLRIMVYRSRNLIAMASTLEAMASNLLAMASALEA